MMSFKEVLKTALSYKEARRLAIISAAGIVLAAMIPIFFGNTPIGSVALVGICMVTFGTTQQFCSFFREIRVADMEAHGKQVYKRESPKKKKK